MQRVALEWEIRSRQPLLFSLLSHVSMFDQNVESKDQLETMKRKNSNQISDSNPLSLHDYFENFVTWEKETGSKTFSRVTIVKSKRKKLKNLTESNSI